MSRNPGRRPRREQRRTILLVTNGRNTEKDYLDHIKRSAQRNLAITVKFENGDPLTLVRKLTRPLGDGRAYDEVWIVVDQDGANMDEFARQCLRAGTSLSNWHPVISRPCFEVWLVAHFDQVRNYSDQKAAQEHYKKYIPEGHDVKAIPINFPYENAGVATGRCHLAGAEPVELDGVPSAVGTAFPHLLRATGLIE